MVCQRECLNCGDTDDVRWYKDEYYCEGCIEILGIEEDDNEVEW